jgi:tetratricopeptide (TPR) repeat protein
MYEKALIFNKKTCNKEGMANQYNGLGAIFLERGDLARAEEMHTKALELSDELGLKEVMAHTFGYLDTLCKQKDDMDAACAHWRKACDLWHEIGNQGQAERCERLLCEAKCPGV